MLKEKEFILVADIGGTNTTFAIFEEDNLKKLKTIKLETKKITNFTNTVSKILEDIKLPIKAICFAAACPITNKNKCELSNADLSIDLESIKKKTKIKDIFLINDFQALAYGINLINKKDLLEIKKGVKNKTHNLKAVLGAGTGLGKSILVWDNKIYHYKPLPSEGGHADLPIQTQEELDLIQFIKHQNLVSRIEWEHLLSGEGISNIYRYLVNYKKTNYQEEIERLDCDPALITKYRKKDKKCEATINYFLKFYARCAKSLALDTLSYGGIYIAGGIAAKNPQMFKSKFFLNEFLDNTKLKSLLEKIPIYVVKNYEVSLYGAALATKILTH
ncbi:ROK family protein [Candidatus Woesearchaeota archaeon]|nr:ROK family protein [Candidatus Woesearchaeota archaeon]